MQNYLKRIDGENDIFSYFIRQKNYNYYQNLISNALSLNDYSELENLKIIFSINSLDDFFLKIQIKKIINSKINFNCFVHTIKDNLFSRITKYNIDGILDSNEKINYFSNQESQVINLISSDLLFSKNVLIDYFEETELDKFNTLTSNIYILPTSYLLYRFQYTKKFFVEKVAEENDIILSSIKNSKEIKDNLKKDFLIIWPKNKLKNKIIYEKVILKSFDNLSKDVIDNLIPNDLIRNYEQKALLVDKENEMEDYKFKTFNFHLKPNKIKPKHLHAYLNHGGSGNIVLNAIIRSLNLKYSYAEDFEDLSDGIPIIWGVLRNSKTIIDYAQKLGHYFYYIDHAYYNRGHRCSYRITRNKFEAGQIKSCPKDRLKKLKIIPKKWKKGGKKILVCPPTEYFQEAHGSHNWLQNTLEILRRNTDRKIVIRRKPKPGSNPKPLDEAFSESYALVAHSSNIAVEAVISGVPVFVSNKSACAPIGQTDFSKIESPIYPDREPWLAHLAYSQFSFEEIENGNFFNILKEYEDFDFI